ncbi:MAG: type II toxin-antitoxin system RelE/ParE family toxin [Actinomycetota bacterium]|nr:type II toxin-antitoxin system RelE/ParE family toxin [Actinomycetota bacterium]
MKVIWTPIAQEQVAEAFTYISAENPGAALGWFDRIVARTESLSALPDQGHMVPEAERESIREVLVAPYRVIYRRDSEEAITLTVQHERRDLDIEGVDS